MDNSFQINYLKRVQTILIWVLLAQAALCAGIALYNNLPALPVLGIGLVIFCGPLICRLLSPGGRLASFACAIGLMCSCSLAIHSARGMIEFHFLIFVELALLIVVRDWLVIVAAAATVAVQHTAFYFLLPASVFNYQASFGVLILHATFVVLETIPACLIAHYFGKSVRAQYSVSESLNQVAALISAASGQMLSASHSVAEGASEQAAALEETSSSLEEMSAQSKRSSENARKANDLAKEARIAADRGLGDMQTMSAAMEDIKTSSDDIAKIIKTIDSIAFQTRILAFNASVEAARAGEAGLGFAVVANEVGNLAARCTQAARETSGKIEAAIVKTTQGVEISRKVAANLNEITGAVQRVDELVTAVTAASVEQSEGIAQINLGVRQMDKITQTNAATAEESAAAAGDLNSHAKIMKQSVTQLLELVGGNASAARLAPEVETDVEGEMPAAALVPSRVGAA
jgi:hypothetical protein